MFKNFHKNKYNSGFTFTELLVVMAIFMIITSITIFNYGSFNASISIQNLADDIALSVRRTQSFAIGVQGARGIFSDGYGVHFTTDTTSSKYFGSKKSFVLYADLNTSTLYKYTYNNSSTCGTPTSTNECLELLNIISADEIKDIRLNGESGGRSPTGTIDIIFKRPDPAPYFCYRMNNTQSSCTLEGNNISSVQIMVSNIADTGISKVVNIAINGQISVSSK